MRNIKDLKPNECIKISTKKEACKLVKILNESGLKRSSGEKITFKWIWDEKYPYLSTQLGYVDIYNNPPGIIISTSEFLPKKHKRKKQLYNSIVENTHDIKALRSTFMVLADKVDSLPSVHWGDNGVVKVNIPGLKLEDSVTITPEALLFEPSKRTYSDFKSKTQFDSVDVPFFESTLVLKIKEQEELPLTELPEKWFVKYKEIDLVFINKYRNSKFLPPLKSNRGCVINNGENVAIIDAKEKSHTEISTEDFKRLVLKENVLEVGKWYKRKQGCMFLFSGKYDKTDNLPTGYGFLAGKEFVSCDGDTGWGLSEGDNWILTSNEEVEAVLINEAKNRGFKDNIEMLSNGSKVYLSENNGCFQLSGNCLWFGGYIIFRNGIWAEVVKPVKEEIDWSKPGQIIVNQQGSVWMTTGNHRQKSFSGVLLKSVDDKGIYSEILYKKYFKLYTSEPITLSN